MTSYRNDVRHDGYSLANQHAVLDNISEISETSAREEERFQASRFHARKTANVVPENNDIITDSTTDSTISTDIHAEVGTKTPFFTFSQKNDSDSTSLDTTTSSSELTEEEKEIKKYYFYAVIALSIATLCWSIMGPSFVYLNRLGVMPIMAAAWRNLFIFAFVAVPASIEAYLSLTINHWRAWFCNTGDEIDKALLDLASSPKCDLDVDADANVNIGDTIPLQDKDIQDATDSLNPHAPPSIQLGMTNNRNIPLSNQPSHIIDISHTPIHTPRTPHTPSLTPSFGPSSLAGIPLEDLSLDDGRSTSRSRMNSMSMSRSISMSTITTVNPEEAFQKRFPILPTSTGSIWDRPGVLLILASILWGLSLSLWVTALRFTTTVVASLLASIAPILIVIYYKIVNIPVSRQESLAVFIAFSGLILCLCSSLIVPGDSRNNDENEMAIEGPFANIIGGVLCILAAACIAIEAKYASIARRHIPVFAFSFAGTFCVCVLCLVLSLMIEGGKIFCRQHDCFFGFSHPDFILPMLLLGFVGGWMGLVGSNFAVKYVSNVLFTVGPLIDPVLTIFISYALGYESLPQWPVYAGGSIVLLGIVLLVLGETKRKEKEKIEAEAESLAEQEAKADLIAADLVTPSLPIRRQLDKEITAATAAITTNIEKDRFDKQNSNYDQYKQNKHQRQGDVVAIIDHEEVKTEY